MSHIHQPNQQTCLTAIDNISYNLAHAPVIEWCKIPSQQTCKLNVHTENNYYSDALSKQQVTSEKLKLHRDNNNNNNNDRLTAFDPGQPG